MNDDEVLVDDFKKKSIIFPHDSCFYLVPFFPNYLASATYVFILITKDYFIASAVTDCIKHNLAKNNIRTRKSCFTTIINNDITKVHFSQILFTCPQMLCTTSKQIIHAFAANSCVKYG